MQRSTSSELPQTDAKVKITWKILATGELQPSESCGKEGGSCKIRSEVWFSLDGPS